MRRRRSSAVKASSIDDQLLSPRDRFRARPLHRRPGRRQARRRHRAAQPLAPPAAAGRPQGGGAAEEHPDDRADGRRQDGDLAPPRQAGRRAVHQGRGDEVHRGRLRRPRRRQHHPRSRRGGAGAGEGRQAQGRARAGREERRGARARRSGGARLVAGDAELVPQEAAHRRAERQGDRDPGRGFARRAACRCSTFPASPARSIGAINIGDMFGKAFGSAPSRAASPCRTATTC